MRAEQKGWISPISNSTYNDAMIVGNNRGKNGIEVTTMSFCALQKKCTRNDNDNAGRSAMPCNALRCNCNGE